MHILPSIEASFANDGFSLVFPLNLARRELSAASHRGIIKREIILEVLHFLLFNELLFLELSFGYDLMIKVNDYEAYEFVKFKACHQHETRKVNEFKTGLIYANGKSKEKDLDL